MTIVWKSAPAAILVLSALILGTALASQYVGGLAPCDLCIWQRWPYAAAIGLSLAALTVPRRPAARSAAIGLCGIVFAIGGAVAFYHLGVEEGWFQGPAGCSAASIDATTIEGLRRQLEATAIVRCDEVQWSLMGISLAGFNLIASTALAAGSFVLALRSWRRRT